jgi:LysR family glycine cleavage system transcriptional activator
MRPRLPPLNALPSFEAAARHLSFSKAAEELHVTHGAVSHAVRNLEDHLGLRLMIRASRSVRLTPVGASFAAEIRNVLEHLAAATSAATGQTSRIVSVSTIDSFAARWLMPRLFRFRRAHGDIDVRVATSERLADFVSDGIDIAIRCGAGKYPGLSAELLMKEDHFPVCSPKLLKGRHPLRIPADLAHHTLLHDVFTVDWPIWLRNAGIDIIDAHRGPTFLSSDHRRSCRRAPGAAVRTQPPGWLRLLPGLSTTRPAAAQREVVSRLADSRGTIAQKKPRLLRLTTERRIQGCNRKCATNSPTKEWLPSS